MPWNESNLMNERLKLVARLLDGESMTTVCNDFGISRKTGYKIFNRYKEIGIEGLQNQSRRPHRSANKIPFQVERSILRIKKEWPQWRFLGQCIYFPESQRKICLHTFFVYIIVLI